MVEVEVCDSFLLRVRSRKVVATEGGEDSAQVEGGGSRSFLDFFWVPRVLGPAGSAEPKVGNRNHECFDASLVALMETEAFGFLVFHVPILLYFGVGVVVLNALIWKVLKVFFGLSC